MAAGPEPRETRAVSDLFDPEGRRIDEARPDDPEARPDEEPRTPTNEPPARSYERPARSYERPARSYERPARSYEPLLPPMPERAPTSEPSAPTNEQPAPAYEQRPAPGPPEPAPWRVPEESAWPYRPEPPQPASPPEPPPRRGLNPLVRLGVPQPWRAIIDWIVTIAGAIAIVLAIKAWVVNPYRIPSSSMEPTLHCARGGGSGCLARFSDRVLANRFIYHFRDPHRGEIIVFDVPKKAEEACGAGGVFVKRIIGLPGELWQERQGYVYINGKKLIEPYIKPDRRDFASWPRRRIPKGNYFMMGDNRQSSCDSRRWGPVPRKSIIGKVFAIYWPPQRIRLNP
jgi:signal peptidase I